MYCLSSHLQSIDNLFVSTNFSNITTCDKRPLHSNCYLLITNVFYMQYITLLLVEPSVLVIYLIQHILNRWTPLCTTHPKTMCYYFYNLRFRRGVLHLCFLSTYHHSLIQSSCPCSYTETLYRWLNCMCPHWHNISQYIDLKREQECTWHM